MIRIFSIGIALAAVACGTWLAAGEEKAKTTQATAEVQASRESAQEALAEFNSLIGGWRGVGQPVRNSNKGSWSETAEWIWELKADRVGIRYSVKDGKHLRSGLLTWDPRSKEFELAAKLADETERSYRGTQSGNKLTLQSPADDKGEVHQLAITQLNEKRTLVLFQTRGKGQPQFQR